MPDHSLNHDEQLLVQIASYNTNLQGNHGPPQDYADWLAPTLKVSSFLSRARDAPDIVAVGFQELLPLHLGLSGLSKQVIQNRDEAIRSQVESFAPNKEKYTLVAKVVNVGVALLVYVLDEKLGDKLCDVQTQWTGTGPGWMGNKGAVGVRFRLKGKQNEDPGETFTFVCAHLTAHSHKLYRRVQDYHHIVASLLFPPTKYLPSYTTMYSTSHLFFLGDLNFRVDLPKSHPLADPQASITLRDALNEHSEREQIKEHDQLLVERKKGSIFVGLKEGEFWQFKCTYKYQTKEIDKYSSKRVPSWCDRVLYSTYLDSSEETEKSHINLLLYTSILSYTTSDHKPIVALLLVPSSVLGTGSSESLNTPPLLKLPDHYNPTPDPYWRIKRYTGRILDRLLGFTWSFFWLLGLGNAFLGVGNIILGLVAWSFFRQKVIQTSSV